MQSKPLPLPEVRGGVTPTCTLQTNKGGDIIGKPTKLTPEVQERMVQLLKAGNRLELCADECGIDYTTHRNWIKRGEAELLRLGSPRTKEKESEVIFVEYFNAIKKATALAEISNVAVIQKSARGGTEVETQTIESYTPDGKLKSRKVIRKMQPPDWTAAAWWLERRMPHVYGRQDRLKVEMEVQAQLEQLFGELRGVLSPAALGEIEAYILSRSEEQPAERPRLSN